MDDVFKLIGTYQYSSEAIIFKGKLESEGIEVFMRDNFIVEANSLYSNAIGGVKLFVYQKDFLKAKGVISQVSQYSLDENNKLLKCPNCNTAEINVVTSVKDLKSLIFFVFSLLLSIFPFYVNHKYKCSKCKFEFN